MDADSVLAYYRKLHSYRVIPYPFFGAGGGVGVGPGFGLGGPIGPGGVGFGGVDICLFLS